MKSITQTRPRVHRRETGGHGPLTTDHYFRRLRRSASSAMPTSPSPAGSGMISPKLNSMPRGPVSVRTMFANSFGAGLVLPAIDPMLSAR